MGQAKSLSHIETSERTRFQKAEKIDILLSSAIKPNGILPDELVRVIMNLADVISYRALALACKIYYKASLATNYGGNLPIARANLSKGVFWAETLSTRFMPKNIFSYVASFQRNKILVNNHSFLESSVGFSKILKTAFMMDLTTMTKTEVPYGCVFANDYFVKNTKENGEYFFDWDTFDVLDKNFKVLHSIPRKNKTSPRTGNHVETEHPNDIIQLHINQSGMNSIILSNLHLRDTPSGQILDDLIDRKLILEVYDLKTGTLTLERRVEANRILAYYGNYVVMVRKEHVIAVDLLSKYPDLTLSSDVKKSVYINDDEIGLVENSKFKVFSFSELRLIRDIDLKPILSTVKGEGKIQALAFDDYKLVVTYGLAGAMIYFVISLESEKLLTPMYTPYDKILEPTQHPQVHLTPNGKIVTDALNLTVYDFVHPNVHPNPELTIPVSYFEDKVVQQTSIRLPDLNKFAMDKLKVTFDLLRTRTALLSRDDGKFRATIIFSEKDGQAAQSLLSKISGQAEEQRRCAWQLTLTDPSQVIDAGFYNSVHTGDIYYKLSLRSAVVVFEEFNSKKNQWEFCKSCVDYNA